MDNEESSISESQESDVDVSGRSLNNTARGEEQDSQQALYKKEPTLQVPFKQSTIGSYKDHES